MLFADVSPDFWTVTLPAMLGAAIVAIGGVVLTAVKTASIVLKAIRDLKAEVKTNTDITKDVIPQVAKKVESATREAQNAAAETKKETQTTAAKLALHNEENTAKIMDALGDVGTKIKGEDGTCLTARMAKLEDGHKTLADGQEAIRTEVAHGLGEVREAIKSLAQKFA